MAASFFCPAFEVRTELTQLLHNTCSKADLDMVDLRVDCLPLRSLHNIHYSGAGLR